ncbi:MAG: uracil-DNA glycosylase [Pseudomonadota bacterium]
MSLDLDERQRAMLQEMGVRVWLPQPEAGMSLPEPVRASAPPAPAAVVQRATPAVAREMPEMPAFAGGGYPLGGAGATPVSGQDLALQEADALGLRAAAAACQACGLCAGRKNSTLQMPDTAVQADWLVLGDPPDEDEDRLGQPFVEQAGVLLDNMLKAVGASRSGQGRQGAYLSNVVKCRPPMGRQPQAAELAQCAQYLQREIALVQPKIILAMGRFAAQLALEEHPADAALPLGKQRGRVYRYRGVPVIVSYHPKVLLRASADKAKAWADLCLGLDTLEGSPR